MPILLEEVEGMFKDGRAALYTVVHPCCTVFFLVEGDGGCLATADVHALNEGDFEFVGMVGESGGGGLQSLSVTVSTRGNEVANHASGSCTDDDHLLSSIFVRGHVVGVSCVADTGRVYAARMRDAQNRWREL